MAWSDVRSLITLTRPVTSWKFTVKALTLQHAAVRWILAESFYYSQSSRYHLFLLSSASELISFPMKLLNEPRRAV